MVTLYQYLNYLANKVNVLRLLIPRVFVVASSWIPRGGVYRDHALTELKATKNMLASVIRDLEYAKYLANYKPDVVNELNELESEVRKLMGIVDNAVQAAETNNYKLIAELSQVIAKGLNDLLKRIKALASPTSIPQEEKATEEAFEAKAPSKPSEVTTRKFEVVSIEYPKEVNKPIIVLRIKYIGSEPRYLYAQVIENGISMAKLRFETEGRGTVVLPVSLLRRPGTHVLTVRIVDENGNVLYEKNIEVTLIGGKARPKPQPQPIKPRIEEEERKKRRKEIVRLMKMLVAKVGYF